MASKFTLSASEWQAVSSAIRSHSNCEDWITQLLETPVSELVAQETLSAESGEITGSYLEFLGEQIALEPRGPEWTQVLTARKSALEPFKGRELILIHLRGDAKTAFVRLDPGDYGIVHWESD